MVKSIRADFAKNQVEKKKSAVKVSLKIPSLDAQRLNKLKTGPETLYLPEYCQEAVRIMTQGGGRVEVAGALNVHKGTLLVWEENFPEFKEAMMCAQVKEEVHWKAIGVVGMLTPEFNNRSYEFNMINRFEGWRMKDLTAPPTIINVQDNSLLDQIKENARNALGDKK